jgi:hypothetical protein
MSKIDRNAVREFYDHYHATKIKRPNLYRTTDDMITVVLPADLLEYSNAAAGHSGFGSGARPVGIRRAVHNSSTALEEIFESVNSLENFILSSEADGLEHVQRVRQAHATGVPVRHKEPKASDAFWAHYSKDVMLLLVNKFGRNTVEQSWKHLTLSEFEWRFGLQKAA